MDDAGSRATRLLEHEARALLTRLDQDRPFALHETMVLAAALPYSAHCGASSASSSTGRRRCGTRCGDFLDWLRGPGRHAPPGRAAAPVRR